MFVNHPLHAYFHKTIIDEPSVPDKGEATANDARATTMAARLNVAKNFIFQKYWRGWTTGCLRQKMPVVRLSGSPSAFYA